MSFQKYPNSKPHMGILVISQYTYAHLLVRPHIFKPGPLPNNSLLHTKDSEKMETSSYESNSTFSTTPYPQSQSSNQSLHHETRSGFFKNEDVWPKTQIKRKKNQVFLQGYVETSDEEELVRARSLTDEDLEELKGCLDLGFGFSYDEIPELCNTLPALELCYSMSQKFLDDQQKSPESTSTVTDSSPPPSGGKANWKISSPGDDPEDVKARLKFWAQAVACTVRLCS
uniref:Uncharacterized protein n=2 Tax=Lactuca sativa TaxID=4236 RepID=A0A9R1WJ81_LACSA|nr:hypothetical protein LSAT_V11C100027860 [Lactuca sativa]